MAAMESLSHLVDIHPRDLTRLQNLILEIELFTHMYEELKEIYRFKNKNFFSLIKDHANKEDDMLEANLLCFIVNDILSTEEYSLAGIACYTQIPEEVICDIVLGRNQLPSLALSQKIINLHRAVRPDLYKDIIKKIIDTFFNRYKC